MTARVALGDNLRSGPSLDQEAEQALTGMGSDRRPIFRWDNPDHAVYYAPGCLCVVGQASTAQFETTIRPAAAGTPPETGSDWGAELWRRAGLAVAAAARRREGPFEPECLTLYMNNECNLRCAYCYADPAPQSPARLDLDLIAAAAEVVAGACHQKACAFTIVFHGGGEPMLHRQRVEEALVTVRAIAARHGVETFLYMATNGVLSEEDAVWLAREFDLIGLSCDGPPKVHNHLRPRRDGSGSLHLVERAGRILREEGCRLHVRTTVTRDSLARQAEIAEFICQRFSPEEIHFEPVYLGGRTGPSTGLEARHATEYVTHFLEARSLAQGYGVRLSGSGSRPGSLHGPFCHPFRNVINLVPGHGSASVATACFKLSDADRVREKGACIGELDRRTGRFKIDTRRVQSLRQRLDATLPACDGCFNFYHCARLCPDACPLDDGFEQTVSAQAGFRCRVQKATTAATLQETAARLWSEAKHIGDGKPRGTAIS